MLLSDTFNRLTSEIPPGFLLRRPETVTVATVPVLPLTVSDLGFDAGGYRLLDGISFRLQAGTCALVMGPNGAGKSLLLRLCHGLLSPSTGAIDWGGQTPAQAHRWLTMVFQHPVLLRRSVAANIAYALSVRGVARRERGARIADALARTDLVHLADRPARTLSGGEQQRLAIARAWALDPQVMFLDEPTSNLDPAATRAIEALIGAIHRAGTTLVMTTHDLGQARRLAQEVLFLHHGRLLEHTPGETFFTRPHSAEAAAFLRGELLI